MNRLLAVLFLTSSAPAAAAVLTVDPSGDGDATTVRAGIDLASSGDTIYVEPGTYTGGLDTGGKDLSLIATGDSSNTFIVGAEGGVVFSVVSGETVSLAGFTLRDGEQGLYVNDSTVELQDVTIQGMSSSASGAGLYVGNGAVLSGRSVAILGNSSGASNGGGVHVRHAQLTLANSALRSNAGGLGGALYLYNAEVELSDVEITENTATTGGAIFMDNTADLVAVRVTMDDNSAGSGGGLYATDATIDWTSGTASGNSTGGEGGAFYLDTEVSATLTGVQVLANVAAGAGGGIFSRGADLDFGGTLEGNSTSADAGAGLWFDQGSLGLDGAEISNHSALIGAGLYLGSAGVATGEGAHFTANSAERGAGVYAAGELALTDARFVGNVASDLGGGAYAQSPAVLIAPTFRENESPEGAGIAAVTGLTVEGGLFELNVADAGAGLYHRDDGTLKVAGATFQYNAAPAGAALFAASSEQVILEGLTLLGHPDGEAVTAIATPLTVLDSSFTNSGAAIRGDALPEATLRRLTLQAGDEGLVLTGSADALVTNCFFLGQELAAVRAETSALTLENVDLLAGSAHALVASAGATVEVVNAIAVYNRGGWLSLDGSGDVGDTGDTGDTGGDTAAPPPTASVVSVRYSDLWHNGDDPEPAYVGEDGNIEVEPAFFDFSHDGDWTNDVLSLSPKSPCRDTGDPKISDLDGSSSDMGAYGGPEAEVTDKDGDGYAPSEGDCDDEDPTVSPGAAEIWYDGIDQDCGGDDDYDQDGDGYQDASAADVDEDDIDCDDTDPAIHPDAGDTEGDGVDQNCDGVDGLFISDEEDRDGDGFTTLDGDCNDDDPAVNPVVPEICDDLRDNNCDGQLDGDDAACAVKGCGCASALSPSSPAAIWLLLPLGVLLRRRSSGGLRSRAG